MGPGAEREYANHPVSLWVREEALLNGIFGFFSERVFGPRRRELLEQDSKQVDLQSGKKARARIDALERSIEQLEARQTRLIRSLEHTDDPHGAVFRKIRDRMSEIGKRARPEAERT